MFDKFCFLKSRLDSPTIKTTPKTVKGLLVYTQKMLCFCKIKDTISAVSVNWSTSQKILTETPYRRYFDSPPSLHEKYTLDNLKCLKTQLFKSEKKHVNHFKRSISLKAESAT